MIDFASDESIDVHFGQHISDVLQSLGNPNKEHCSSSQSDSDGCYFLNYLEFGFDLAFAARDHTLKKIILRCNQLSDPNFGFYGRCNFSICDENKDVDITPLSSFSKVRP